jgi:hypothetical protein
MKYGFPQISNARAIKLLTGERESDQKFDLLTSENKKNYHLKRKVRFSQIDPTLDEEILDPSVAYSEITAQNRQKVNKKDTLYALNYFRREILELAKSYGYPGPFNSSINGSEFNHKLSVLVWKISEELGMTPVNAASNGVWNYLQVIGCPSVACWRWENRGVTVLNRMIGSTRGAFATAWWRYAVLTDFGKYDYEDWIYKLSEDAIQNILERPGMRGYSPVIIPFARRIANLPPGTKPNPVKFIRTAAIQLRIKSSTSNFWYLLRKEQNADKIVAEIFETTTRILSNRE